MKTITIEGSKYTIKYDPTHTLDWHLYRFKEEVHGLKSNVMNDMVFWLIENLEAGDSIKGFTIN